MNVALYLRRSTNERLQADSLKVQEQILRRYASDHAMTIVEVFRDSASGTSTKHRTEFLRMVETITHGAAFAAVLVRDVSRFGRFFDVDEGAFFEVLFLGHGVKTIYCEEVFTSDTSPMASLIKSVRRVMASEYSRDRSRLIRYAQSRATRLGFLAGGPPPYGMRRVMVTPGGAFVQDLARGQWKALANHRTRLVAGDPAAVATVRRIFDLYDADGLGVTTIVERLNAEGVPAPEGGRWYEPTVAAVLENSVYAGLGHYTPLRKAMLDPLPPSQVEDLRVRDAAGHEAIISIEQFRRVEARRNRQTRRRSNAVLAADARAALALHGCVEPAMLARLDVHCSWATYAKRFPGGADEALALAYADAIRDCADRVIERLSDAVTCRAEGALWIIDETLRLAIEPLFPHRRRSGAYWRLLPQRAADVYLCIGLTPDGKECALFLVGSDLLLDRPRGFFLRIDLRGRTARFAVSIDTLGERLRQLRYVAGEPSENRFLAAAREKTVTNFAVLARELDWPHHAVRKMYWRLTNRGEWLPPLKYKAGRRIEIVCAVCGKARWERPNRALVLRSNICFACTARRPKHRIAICCPSCGRTAERWPSAVKKLSNGAQTICRMCRVRAGLKRTPKLIDSEVVVAEDLRALR